MGGDSECWHDHILMVYLAGDGWFPENKLWITVLAQPVVKYTDMFGSTKYSISSSETNKVRSFSIIGKIHTALSTQEFPPVWLWALSLPTQRSLRWSQPLASLGLWDITQCGVWPPLCTPPSCLSQTPSQVRPMFNTPTTISVTVLFNLGVFSTRSDCSWRSGPDGWGSNTRQPPSGPRSHRRLCFLH